MAKYRKLGRRSDQRKALIRDKARLQRGTKVSLPENLKKKTKSAVAEKVNQYLEERGVDEATRAKAVQEVLNQKPRRIERVMTKESREKGGVKRGAGERFDFYVKRNHVLEPKHMFSGKSGFKRDFK